MRAAWLACLVACGYPTLPRLGAGQDASHSDAPRDGRMIDAPADARGDAAIDAPAGPVLTLKNYLSWCTFTVNGGPALTSQAETISDTAGTTYTLTATPASASFELGPNMWHHTDNDTNNTGEPGTVSGGVSTSHVTAHNGETCVWVCCPFANPPGTGCPTADQCP